MKIKLKEYIYYKNNIIINKRNDINNRCVILKSTVTQVASKAQK